MSSMQYTPRHRRRHVLEEMVEAGMNRKQMAKELRVGTSTIITWCNRLGVERPQTDDQCHISYDVSEPNFDFEGVTCPECGRKWQKESSQQACMRKHAKDRAAFLAAYEQ